MKKSLQRKLACTLNLSPELNRTLLQCKRSWDEVSGIINLSCKKQKTSSGKTKH